MKKPVYLIVALVLSTLFTLNCFAQDPMVFPAHGVDGDGYNIEFNFMNLQPESKVRVYENEQLALTTKAQITRQHRKYDGVVAPVHMARVKLYYGEPGFYDFHLEAFDKNGVYLENNFSFVIGNFSAYQRSVEKDCGGDRVRVQYALVPHFGQPILREPFDIWVGDKDFHAVIPRPDENGNMILELDMFHDNYRTWFLGQTETTIMRTVGDIYIDSHTFNTYYSEPLLCDADKIQVVLGGYQPELIQLGLNRAVIEFFVTPDASIPHRSIELTHLDVEFATQKGMTVSNFLVIRDGINMRKEPNSVNLPLDGNTTNRFTITATLDNITDGEALHVTVKNMVFRHTRTGILFGKDGRLNNTLVRD